MSVNEPRIWDGDTLSYHHEDKQSSSQKWNRRTLIMREVLKVGKISFLKCPSNANEQKPVKRMSWRFILVIFSWPVLVDHVPFPRRTSSSWWARSWCRCSSVDSGSRSCRRGQKWPPQTSGRTWLRRKSDAPVDDTHAELSARSGNGAGGSVSADKSLLICSSLIHASSRGVLQLFWVPHRSSQTHATRFS